MFKSLFEKYSRIIFFDTETTGFDAENADQIIELAAIAVDPDGAESTMDEFIQLFRLPELPEKITELTGILPFDLTMGKEEHEVLQEFMSLINPDDSTLLVAHNAQFDLIFLAYSLYRHKDEEKDWMRTFNHADYLDTMTVYKDRASFPHKLESAISHYGLAGKVENSHRAIDDTRALIEVAKKMDAEKDDLYKYINIFGINPKYEAPEHQIYKVRYVSQSTRAVIGPAIYEK